MPQIEFSLQTGLFVLIGLALLAGLFLLVKKLYFTGEHGNPAIDALNCATRTVLGHIPLLTSEKPDSFKAYIYADDGSTTGSEANVPDFDIDNGLPKKYTLRNVPSDDIPPTGPVFVRVIAVYHDGDEKEGTRRFDCHGGSGSGSPVLVALRNQQAASPKVTTTAPHQFTLAVPGFIGNPLSVFNRAWSLTHRASACLQVQWDNGGNGRTSPLVQLSTAGLHGFPWELRFELGDVVVTYAIAADDWRPLAENIFRNATHTGIEGAVTLPAALTVTPA